MGKCFLFFMTILCFSGLYSEKTVRLQYVPNVNVKLESQISLELSQSFPPLNLSTQGKQRLEALVFLHSQSGFPITESPFDLTFRLFALKMDLEANGEKISFDSQEKDSSIYLSQFAKLQNTPLKIHFADGFHPKEDDESIIQAMNELPVLREIGAKSFLAELFFYPFALGGKDLVQGRTYPCRTSDFCEALFPEGITYTVTEIDDYKVRARLYGMIDKGKIPLKGISQSVDNSNVPLEMTLSGTVEGTVSWNRDNALLYQLDVRYGFTAKGKYNDSEWLTEGSLHQKSGTRLN